MRDVDRWGLALVGATGVHAGFQLTVSTVVYPALADLPASGWERGHAAHSRRITPLVALIYPAVALTLAGRLRAAPDPAAVASAACSGLVVALTAGVAAPLHQRLGDGHDPVRLNRLLQADRGRSALAVAALLAAVGAQHPGVGPARGPHRRRGSKRRGVA